MRSCLLVCAAVAVAAGCGKKDDAPAEGLDALVEELRSPDARTRRLAAEEIGKLGAKAKPAVPALTTALTDTDDGVRANAAGALWATGSAAKEAIPALVKALKDRNQDVRLSAAGALGEMAPDSTAEPNRLDATLRSNRLVTRGQMTPADG